jgi:shikimate kinase
MKKNNIVLIGFMGSGKSTVGIKLSYRLRRIVEDTDKLIEKKAGRSIADIFATEGEGYFRNLETQTLKKLCQSNTEKILSLGGGTPVREENRPLIKELGTVVYLRAKPDTIYERLKEDTTRPLLQGEDPQGKIRTMITQRGPLYEIAADCIIDVDGKDFEQIISGIEEAVSK